MILLAILGSLALLEDRTEIGTRFGGIRNVRSVSRSRVGADIGKGDGASGGEFVKIACHSDVVQAEDKDIRASQLPIPLKLRRAGRRK